MRDLEKFLERGFLKRGSVERGSLERGATLLEILFVITCATVFALAVFAYYSQTSTRWSLIETQDDISKAIRDVQESYPSHRFGGMRSADLREAVRDKNTPLGEIDVSRNSADPSDAFRVTLTDMPSADQDALCASLLERMLKAPNVESGLCRATASTSEMEIRVRGQQIPDIPDIALEYADIPNCRNACNRNNWRGAMPTVEEMRVVADVLELITRIHTTQDSCDASTWGNFYQCIGREPSDSRAYRHKLGYIRSPSGNPYRIVGKNVDAAENYPSFIRMVIDKEVGETLKKYTGHVHLRDGTQDQKGYRGLFNLYCDIYPVPAHECDITVFVQDPRLSPGQTFQAWWQREGN